MLALKLEIFVEELGIISVRECRNVIVVNAELRGDGWVNDCGFGLTMVSVVVVDTEGEGYRQCYLRESGGGKTGNRFWRNVVWCCKFGTS